MLDDLVALCVDVGDEVEHFELQLLGTDVHHVEDHVDFVGILLAFPKDLLLLGQLLVVVLDDTLNFFLFFGDFLLELSLFEPPAPGLLHLVLSDQPVLNPEEELPHAVHQYVSMIFHENFLEASAAFEFEAEVVLADAALEGKVVEPEIVKAGESVEVFLEVDDEGLVVAERDIVDEVGAAEDGGELAETGLVVLSGHSIPSQVLLLYLND